MEARKAWTCDELQNGIVIYHGIETEIGTLPDVYLGPSGVFVHMAVSSTPTTDYRVLKDLLKLSRIQLYTDDQGLYDPSVGAFSDPVPPEDLSAFALSFVDGSESWPQYTPSELRQMGTRLKHADAYVRGFYRSEEGREYLRRGNAFLELSDQDSELLYYLALFGGVLGIHRFAMGKNITGFLYLVTGGLMLCGWAMDLLFLLLNAQRDKRKRLLRPLRNRLAKLLFLPLGLLVSGLLLWGMRTLLSSVFYGLFPGIS